MYFSKPALATGLALGLAPVASFAADTVEIGEDGLTYPVFESTIEHADLATCPEGFDDEEVFCRLTLASDRAHVFVFTYAGEQPLVAVQSHDLTGDLLNF